MTERRIAVVRDYDGLHRALRQIADERGLTRQQIDAAASFQDGYAGKLLAPRPIRAVGRTTLGPLLSVLGVLIIVAEDPEAVARISESQAKRKRKPGLLAPGTYGLGNLPEIRAIRAQALREALKINGKKGASKGGIARAEKLSRSKRRRIARKAIRCRWAKVKARRRRKGRDAPSAEAAVQSLPESLPCRPRIVEPGED